MTDPGKLAAAIALLTGHHATLSAAATGLGDASRTLIDAWNRRALATPDGEGRADKKAVLARIIDPDAFQFSEWTTEVCLRQARALNKAEDCLAALASRGGGETKCYECESELSGPICLTCNPLATGGAPEISEAMVEAGARAINDSLITEKYPSEHPWCGLSRSVLEAALAASPAPLAPDLGGEAARLALVANGASPDKVYGIEWTMFPIQGLRADLRALLASRAPGLKNG